MTDIRTLADGEQITEPGAYRCSMDWYHSQEICPGPSVSSTGLRKIALQSPHAFWKTWAANPDRYPPKPPSESLILGKAAHSLILGDEVFDDHFSFVPDDAPQRPTKPQIAAYEKNGEWSDNAAPRAEFWDAFDKHADGKMELTSDQYQKIAYMAENLNANPLCVELLKSDMIEISLIWIDELTGIWVKSRVDCLPSNGYDFGDLKTFAPKGRDLILSAQRSVTDYGYPMQMALGVMGSEQVFGQTASNCGIVFCQTSEPYEAIPIQLDEDTLYWARVLCRHGLNTMAECMKTNDWPGVGKDIVKYSYPPSMLHRFGEMQISGLLPSTY